MVIRITVCTPTLVYYFAPSYLSCFAHVTSFYDVDPTVINLIYITIVLRDYLGPREWTLMATWTFREFNELLHFFERRMEGSYECATAYLRQVYYAFQRWNHNSPHLSNTMMLYHSTHNLFFTVSCAFCGL